MKISQLLILLLAVTMVCSSQPQGYGFEASQGYHYGKKERGPGCRELRAKRYISDGMCTTARPIPEVVCPTRCVAPQGERWRCVDGSSKRRRIKLLCKDGSRRVYRVRVVRGCRCTRAGPKGGAKDEKGGAP